MLSLPRLAVGTALPGTNLKPLLWALFEAMRSKGLQVQSFHSRACFVRHRGTTTASGTSPRHLDSWLMTPELCREVLIHGAESADLAVVDGKYADPQANDSVNGGSLEVLCDWLDLPRVVVLDVPMVSSEGIPLRPEHVDALLLDRVTDRAHSEHWKSRLEAAWGVPVLGALEWVDPLREELGAVPSSEPPPRDLCQLLGAFFLRQSEPERLLELAARPPTQWTEPRLFAPTDDAPPLRVALAHDAALDCYFPDTLDALEARGATIVDFSLLRGERLPEGTDLVYLGCGNPEHHAEVLSQNHCMKFALRDHLRNGGRIYAEGDGLAYLCQEIELPGGELRRMAGIFPAVAMLQETRDEPSPMELSLARDTWLGPAGTVLRGYRSPRWQIRPVGPLLQCAAETAEPHALLCAGGAIGSQVQLDFAAQPELFPRFFEPAAAACDPHDPWRAAS
jgi:cobyrinic acid a,c-diamide synthase